jgi:hypothetical protein
VLQSSFGTRERKRSSMTTITMICHIHHRPICNSNNASTNSFICFFFFLSRQLFFLNSISSSSSSSSRKRESKFAHFRRGVLLLLSLNSLVLVLFYNSLSFSHSNNIHMRGVYLNTLISAHSVTRAHAYILLRSCQKVAQASAAS